ncbi:bile acid:sodium symporter family protein [Pararhodonellum marinum]|uniref:bile acid:sodium symporter family protein n=1 Tax=Pararhodonellum marinum TaxID=2755358 RepID=UPI0018907E45|nr:bile acid:sodium symporter family protein [Pararhodonellum marinum]
MEESILTVLFLPLALAFIMMGMGLSLTIYDFKRIFYQPKAILLGLVCQLILLPILGFALIKLFGLSGALAVGVMIIAACPGGATSNLISHLSKGDTALSISLTAISSLVTVATIPLIVNFSIRYFGEEGSVLLPLMQTIAQIFVITIIPVSIGMIIKSKRPDIAKKADPHVRLFSAIFLALIILAAILKERANLVEFFIQVGPVTLLLNVLSLLTGLVVAKLFLLSPKHGLTISIESGIQNGTLGILVAATLLKNSAMAIPSAIYSLIMFMTAVFVIYIGLKMSKKTTQEKVV